MADRNLGSEKDRAIATVTQCELELRRAQETVRCTSEMLRRAVRTAENAQGELGDAARRLGRMNSRLTKAD
jgi:hypothetical protein